MRTAVILCVLATAALAEDNRSVAKEAFREAIRYYNLGDFEKALELFKRAYLNYNEPRILFNTAQCERQLGTGAGNITSDTLNRPIVALDQADMTGLNKAYVFRWEGNSTWVRLGTGFAPGMTVSRGISVAVNPQNQIAVALVESDGTFPKVTVFRSNQ